jgi:hypothetical protein
MEEIWLMGPLAQPSYIHSIDVIFVNLSAYTDY